MFIIFIFLWNVLLSRKTQMYLNLFYWIVYVFEFCICVSKWKICSLPFLSITGVSLVFSNDCIDIITVGYCMFCLYFTFTHDLIILLKLICIMSLRWFWCDKTRQMLLLSQWKNLESGLFLTFTITHRSLLWIYYSRFKYDWLLWLTELCTY